MNPEKDIKDEERDEGIYSTVGREELMDEEDEITDVDEGFMMGYEEGEKIAECQNCGALLVNENVVEEEFDGEIYRFCSSKCASEYEAKKQKS